METTEQFIRNLNDAWINKQFDDLRKYFHDSVVMLPPGATVAITGADNMVESYRQFVDTAKIHAFQTKQISCFNFDSISVCHMPFEIDYEYGGQRSREVGMEVYSIGKFASGLKVVWRTQVPADTNTANT